jgi:hypothetical protein
MRRSSSRLQWMSDRTSNMRRPTDGNTSAMANAPSVRIDSASTSALPSHARTIDRRASAPRRASLFWLPFVTHRASHRLLRSGNLRSMRHVPAPLRARVASMLAGTRFPGGENRTRDMYRARLCKGSTRAGNADFEFSKHSCPAHANTPRHGHKSSIGAPLTTMRLGHAEPRRERPRGRAQGHSRAREPWSFTSRFRSLTLGNR